MALEYGLKAGLAQNFGAQDRINDLRYNEALNRQAAIAAENKAKMFAEDFDYNNAMNSYDNPKVKEFAQFQIKRIGQFVNQNPDWETNVTKRAQYKQLIRELKDNPDLNRGMQSDANYAQFSKDLAEKSKNPGLYDAEAYADIDRQWKNYVKYGNQLGEEAARKEGAKPFVYTQPQDFVDLDKAGLEYGSKFNDFEIKPLKGGFAGSYQEVPKEKSLNVLAEDFYARNKRQMDKRAAAAGFNNGVEYAKELIRPGIKTRFDMGDAGASLGFMKLRAESQKAPMTGVWTKDIANTEQGVVNGDVLKAVLGAKPPLRIMSDDGSKEIDLTGNEVDYSGYNRYIGEGKKRGLKSFHIQTRISKEKAQELGILEDNFIATDNITPEWRNKAKLDKTTGKDGNEIEFITITDMVPFNVNSSTFQGIYDKKAQVTDNVQAPADEYQNKRPAQVVQNGIVYTYNESTGQYE